MAKVNKTGIMAIFDKKPTKFTRFYVKRVTAYVNQERGVQAL